ncbi:MAG: hypothetical protein MZU97_00790 [Bacillus subtilis]|nr:hypothetical protein [Bacillus subtilis]
MVLEKDTGNAIREDSERNLERDAALQDSPHSAEIDKDSAKKCVFWKIGQFLDGSFAGIS